MGHPKNDYHFVVVFAFDSASGTVTMLREFAQAALPHTEMVWGLPCGGFDPRRHESKRHAAQCELSEEGSKEPNRCVAMSKALEAFRLSLGDVADEDLAPIGRVVPTNQISDLEYRKMMSGDRSAKR